MNRRSWLSCCLLIVLVAVMLAGCEEKRKALVSAHTAVGEMLITTRDQAKTLYEHKAINQDVYKSIRTNWLRAQISYVRASDLLEQILSSSSHDITPYTDLITQVSLILNDITLWIEEGKNESGAHSVTGNPTPTPHYEVGGGDTADTGNERGGQGDIKESSAGDEEQGSGNYVGRIGMAARAPAVIAPAQDETKRQRFSSEYKAIYGERQEVTLHGIEDNTAEVRVTILVGSAVYTLDGSEPVMTDGVPYLAIHQSIVLTADEARRFRARCSIRGTQFQVLIFSYD